MGMLAKFGVFSFVFISLRLLAAEADKAKERIYVIESEKNSSGDEAKKGPAKLLMRDPILPGQGRAVEEQEKPPIDAVQEQKKPKKVFRARQLPKKTKTGQEETVSGASKLHFSTYSIGGRLSQPRVEFELEQLELPHVEEPLSLDYREKLKEMSQKRDIGP